MNKQNCPELVNKLKQVQSLNLDFNEKTEKVLSFNTSRSWTDDEAALIAAAGKVGDELDNILIQLENEAQKKTGQEIALEEIKKLEIAALKIEPFIKETFQGWNVTNFDKVIQKPSFTDPQSLNLNILKSDIDPAKLGEFSLNPECLNLDFSQIEDKITIKEISEKEIKDNKLTDLAQIGTYIIKQYSKDYIISDLSFWQWMFQKGANAPQKLKDDNYYYFMFGSVLRYSDGKALVPNARWNGSKFLRDAGDLDDVSLAGRYQGRYVVILLKRDV